ncbi:MAG: hypothetical protein IT423_15205, partial [Pirellulaceae bacterium]|nr:hypothetical protein [Pirellulaceae bacterium]
VVAVVSDEVLTTLATAMGGTDPYGNSPPGGALVWFQDVVLDGPDWSFGPNFTVAAGGGSVTVPTPTTGTLIKGAVSVYERVINVQ